jgi:hypothetical protein
MQTVRRALALLLAVGAAGIWFGMAPESSNAEYRAQIAAALADDKINNTSTQGAPQQTVVNGWTAKDLLTVIASEGAEQDQRPAALLALAVIGLAGGIATSTGSRNESSRPVLGQPVHLETPAPSAA